VRQSAPLEVKSMMPIKIDDIEALCEEFLSSGWRELMIAADDFELTLASDVSALDASESIVVGDNNSAPAPAQAEKCAAPDIATQSIHSPKLGTFRCLPDAAAVEAGAELAMETVIGAIEVLDERHEVTAGCVGSLHAFLVADGDLVEFGQALAEVRISGEARQ